MSTITRVGNPWDVSAGNGTFQMLTGEGTRHLDSLYSTRNYSEEFSTVVARVSESIRGNTLYRNAIGAGRKLIYGRGEDTIRRHRSVGEFQHASRSNQSYLMANPLVRKLYNARKLKGYEEGFAADDKWRGNAYKHSDHNYRIVMDGRLDAEESKFHNYALTADEQCALTNYEDIDILSSWEMQLTHLRDSDEDFSSQFNSLRG